MFSCRSTWYVALKKTLVYIRFWPTPYQHEGIVLADPFRAGIVLERHCFKAGIVLERHCPIEQALFSSGIVLELALS